MLLLKDSAATSRRRKPALTLFLAEPFRGIASHAAFPLAADDAVQSMRAIALVRAAAGT